MRIPPLALAVILLAMPLFAASNPVPHVNNPLVPATVTPGGPAFTLTVNGTGFVSGAVVKWNGTSLATTFVSQGQLTAAVPAARVAAVSTANVTVTNPAPGGGISSPTYFTVTRPSTLLTFSGVKGGPPNTAIGDFNNDGKLDVAGFISGSQYSCPGGFQSNQYVSIALGNGDGTFSAGGTIPFGCLGSNANGIDLKAADVNNDRHQDLAVSFTTSTGSGAAVFLGNGDGTFGSSPTFFTGSFSDASNVVFGDFNNDGKLDCAVSVSLTSGAALYVYPGNGDGTFGSAIVSETTSGGSSYPLAVGDFNGDGNLDLLGANSSSAPAILLGHGDGTFTYSTVALVTGGGLPAVVADLNDDGILDIAFSNSSSGKLEVLLGNGDDTFTAKTGQPNFTGTFLINAADFNGDGKIDLITGDGIFLGNGDGTFPIAPKLKSAPYDFFQSQVGDFNGDGRLDFSGGGINLQAPSAVPSSRNVMFGTQAVGTTSAPKPITLANTGSAALHLSSFTTAGDFAATNNCGTVLAFGKTCTISITFTPTATGQRTGTLSIVDNASNSPQKITLSGTGD
jgi:hypothetical protein